MEVCVVFLIITAIKHWYDND